MQNWESIFDTVEAREKEEAKFEPIEEGTYAGFIDGAKLNETREPAQVSITWKLVGDKPHKFANRKVFANYTLNDKGIPFLKQDLKLLGKTATIATLRDDLESLTGTEAEIFVKPKFVGDKVYYSVYINKVTASTSDRIPF